MLRSARVNRMRKQKVGELRSLVKDGPKPKPLVADRKETKSKRQKTLDMLAGVIGSDSSDEDEGDEEEDLLDWRAKAV